MKTIHPLETTQHIEAAYLRYLKTIKPFQEENLRRAFWEAIETPGTLIKGPLLEVTPPFQTRRSIAQLVEDGLLHEGFERLCSPEALPYERLLFRHQDEAVEHVVGRGRNVIVATGTGSGKSQKSDWGSCRYSGLSLV